MSRKEREGKGREANWEYQGVEAMETVGLEWAVGAEEYQGEGAVGVEEYQGKGAEMESEEVEGLTLEYLEMVTNF